MKNESNFSVKESKKEINGKNESPKEKKFLFKENFKKALKNSGYTQNELANDIYVKNSTISKWLNEENPQPISEVNLLALARHLNVSKDYLLGKTSDDKPILERLSYKIAEQNIEKSKFFKYLGFKKVIYRERNGKFYCMLLNPEGKWNYCDSDTLGFIEDEIIKLAYNMLNDYFNSDSVKQKNKEVLHEIEEDQNKLHLELWGIDMFKHSNIIYEGTEEFDKAFETINTNPENEFEDMKEDEDGRTLVKTKGSNEYRPIEEVPAYIYKPKKMPLTEEDKVNQNRLRQIKKKNL